MNASNKERPNDLARQSSDRTQTKHGSILSWSGSACHNFHRTGRSQHPTSSRCRRECMQHKTSLRAASRSLTELERGRGKGQQNQGKLKKGFTHSSAVNKLHNSTSNGPATDYETMQTLFISNTSSAIHNSPPKLVANVGKRHSRTPSHVHGRHAFCPLRLFLAAAAGSWEHGRTKPPRGKVGERERRVYRRKGERKRGGEGAALLLGGVAAVDDQEGPPTAPAGRRSGRCVIRRGSGGGRGGSQAAASQSLDVVQAQAGSTLGKVLFVFF